MKSLAIASIIAGSLIGIQASTAADMDAGAKLAKKTGCMNCHSIDKKVLGPAFKDVAAKYKGNADAPAALEKKVADGGSGAWGRVPMPPHKGKVSEAEIKSLVEWVLAH